MDSNRVVSVSRVIPAPASKIFDLLADPTQHPRLDGSGTVTKLKKGPHRLFRGAKFSMNMKFGVGYVTTNKVVVFEEDRAIAWHHFAQLVWRYDLEPVEGGTRVTESFDYDKPWGGLIERLGFPERNRIAMEATLERIEHIVTA
jgi:uncharacterized protein YndB with AHSA1/START domain